MNLHQLQMVLMAAIMVLVILIVYFLVRNAATYHRRKTERDQKETTQMGFVVGTFHELVAKLKENERELEELRRTAEDRASSVEVYNENIFQSVPSGMVSFDQGLKIIRMNTAALKLLGLRVEEVVGRPATEVFHGKLAEMIGTRSVIERAETAYTNAAGKRLWLGLGISSLRDSKGSLIGQLLVFTDLSELKAFQSQKELRDRLATLGEMSAGIAHELRNPMAVISGYTKILLKKADEAQRPAVEAIGREIAVMDRIITDFLSFAHPAEPALAAVDLKQLITECAAMTQERPAIRVSLDLEKLPVVRADEVLLRQALSNLIQNALESMPEGGELRVEGSADDQVSIRVSDTGHGIPENIRSRVFLPFFTTKERGTGLGLSIVHKTIASHGGTVDLESGDQGTAFTIRLPKALVVSKTS